MVGRVLSEFGRAGVGLAGAEDADQKDVAGCLRVAGVWRDAIEYDMALADQESGSRFWAWRPGVGSVHKG